MSPHEEASKPPKLFIRPGAIRIRSDSPLRGTYPLHISYNRREGINKAYPPAVPDVPPAWTLEIKCLALKKPLATSTNVSLGDESVGERRSKSGVDRAELDQTKNTEYLEKNENEHYAPSFAQRGSGSSGSASRGSSDSKGDMDLKQDISVIGGRVSTAEQTSSSRQNSMSSGSSRNDGVNTSSYERHPGWRTEAGKASRPTTTDMESSKIAISKSTMRRGGGEAPALRRQVGSGERSGRSAERADQARVTNSVRNSRASDFDLQQSSIIPLQTARPGTAVSGAANTLRRRQTERPATKSRTFTAEEAAEMRAAAQSSTAAPTRRSKAFTPEEAAEMRAAAQSTPSPRRTKTFTPEEAARMRAEAARSVFEGVRAKTEVPRAATQSSFGSVATLDEGGTVLKRGFGNAARSVFEGVRALSEIGEDVEESRFLL